MTNSSLVATVVLAATTFVSPHAARAQAAPVVTSLSATSLPRAGRFIIHGSNFGPQRGSSAVTSGGATAPISNWTDTAITAYVPEAAPLGSQPVQVATSSGASNAVELTVTLRPPQAGHVRWRFQADGPYIQGRPAVGPDGTVYALDVSGHLYALMPNGALKWIFTTSPTAVESVDVGTDGTIYFASAGNSVYAVNPDGTLKWIVNEPSGRQIGAGPNVGPDGNIYAVGEDAGLANGRGEMTISPAGQILSNRRGYLPGRGQEFRTREIVFGTNRFYFSMNNIDTNSGLQFFQLGGTFLFARPAGGSDEQPAVGANGNIYSDIARNQLGVFAPSGNLLRSTFFSGTLSAPNLGSDGTIYQGESFPTNLRALNPDLSVKWTVSKSDYLGGPVVDPSNTVVVVGVNAIGRTSAVQGINATTGALKWRSNLPAENGGFVSPVSRARFSRNGATAYMGMDVHDSAADPYTYLYAFNTGIR